MPELNIVRRQDLEATLSRIHDLLRLTRTFKGAKQVTLEQLKKSTSLPSSEREGKGDYAILYLLARHFVDQFLDYAGVHHTERGAVTKAALFDVLWLIAERGAAQSSNDQLENLRYALAYWIVTKFPHVATLLESDFKSTNLIFRRANPLISYFTDPHLIQNLQSSSDGRILESFGLDNDDVDAIHRDFLAGLLQVEGIDASAIPKKEEKKLRPLMIFMSVFSSVTTEQDITRSFISGVVESLTVMNDLLRLRVRVSDGETGFELNTGFLVMNKAAVATPSPVVLRRFLTNGMIAAFDRDLTIAAGYSKIKTATGAEWVSGTDNYTTKATIDGDVNEIISTLSKGAAITSVASKVASKVASTPGFKSFLANILGITEDVSGLIEGAEVAALLL
jgi:hypothetical protein